ncbi:MAG: chemotaxis protein CheX [bacterium]
MKLQVDEALLDAVLHGTERGLEMTGVQPPAVGASNLFSADRSLAVMVGLVGRDSGTLTLNVSERAMLVLAGKLLGDDQHEINDDSIDAIMEIGNMIAGCAKDRLLEHGYEVQAISVPSLIFGASYDVYYARGIRTVSVQFELPAMPVAFHRDRIFSTTLSLLRRLA